MQIERLKLADIKSTVKTQTREEINKEALADYIVAAKASKAKGADSPFPPLVVYRDDNMLDHLSSGFTRRAALLKAGYEETDCEVRSGTARDALANGFKANNENGVRLTNADKKHNLMKALDDPEWAQMTDADLAELIGTSPSFVRENRPVAKAPATRTRIDKKTGEKKTVTATRTKKKDKPAPEPKKKGKDKPAPPAGDGKPPEPKKDADLEKAIDKIAKAIDGHGYSGDEFRAGVADGSLPLSAANLKKWAATTEERIRNAAALIIGNRWSPEKSFAFLDKQPDADTKADHFMVSANTRGGILQEQVGGFKFIVFNAELFDTGENTKGVITITPKAKAKK